MQKEIKHTWHFSQSPEVVWDYLTKPELMEQWLMKSDFKPVVGHKFYFIGGCEGKSHDTKAAQCQVLEVTPHTRLSYSWQTNSLKDNTPFNSTVLWTITPNKNGSTLQLLHNGFVEVEDVIAHNDGWTRLANRMAELFKALQYERTNA